MTIDTITLSSLEPSDRKDRMSSHSLEADSGVSIQDSTAPPTLFNVDNDGIELLDMTVVDDNEDHIVGRHETITAPLISHDAAILSGGDDALKQYGLLGQIVGVNTNGVMHVTGDKRLYNNTNSPFSALVCGVQGSGKSHTISVLLESMLISDRRLGLNPKPLSALVLHFGEGGLVAKPCEAAFVGQSLSADDSVKTPPVTVFCSPAALKGMTKSYTQKFGSKVTVHPLYFLESEIDVASLLSLMAVNENGGMPLYLHSVMQILSDLGEGYNYRRFKEKIRQADFSPMQRQPLELRLQLLESFLCGLSNRTPFALRTIKMIPLEAFDRFNAGGLTIVDLTDPFISSGSACSIFEIMLKLFNKTDVGTGKVVVLDEAHKYLCETRTEGSKRLTDRLLSFTRQQRHLAMRIVISTQEPTVVPASLLDLCSMIVCHRFYSTGWWKHLAAHVSTNLGDEAFNKVVTLKTGHAMVFCPTALIVKPGSIAPSERLEDLSIDDDDSDYAQDPTLTTVKKSPPTQLLGRGYLLIKSRARLTADGGESRLATDS